MQNGGRLAAEVMGYTVPLIVTFAECGAVLLGRSDFFAFFRVDFDQRNARMKVTPYS
jgi:hypothetical protein